MQDPDDHPHPDDGLSGEDLNRLVEHLQAEEKEAQEATLSSLESFEMWVATHPALRQMAIPENLAQMGPAILEVLKRLLGL
ncbi:MAG: hypothetical protein NW217_09360 [Hyphomicrobiaceae bacterium]|nr:hypothetical protein [Hyphomicrobiaceae bacterium]